MNIRIKLARNNRSLRKKRRTMRRFFVCRKTSPFPTRFAYFGRLLSINLEVLIGYAPKWGENAPSITWYEPSLRIYGPRSRKYVPPGRIYEPDREKYAPSYEKYLPLDDVGGYAPKCRKYAPSITWYVPLLWIYGPGSRKYVPLERIYAPNSEKYAPSYEKTKARSSTFFLNLLVHLSLFNITFSDAVHFF